jgi:hypothetical protein
MVMLSNFPQSSQLFVWSRSSFDDFTTGRPIIRVDRITGIRLQKVHRERRSKLICAVSADPVDIAF